MWHFCLFVTLLSFSRIYSSSSCFFSSLFTLSFQLSTPHTHSLIISWDSLWFHLLASSLLLDHWIIYPFARFFCPNGFMWVFFFFAYPFSANGKAYDFIGLHWLWKEKRDFSFTPFAFGVLHFSVLNVLCNIRLWGWDMECGMEFDPTILSLHVWNRIKKWISGLNFGYLIWWLLFSDMNWSCIIILD